MANDGPAPTPPGHFHAIAFDYDGTLTDRDRPTAVVLDALAETRAAGCSVVLVTGRILVELRRSFPEVDRHFDLIVAENGAVVCHRGVERALVAPVPRQLDAALAQRRISFRRGQVLLAAEAADEPAILTELRRLELECQLIRNRGSLMILPTGVSKGSGLYNGLGDLGISHHNTIAIGDAENDHSLLDVAELGVAVANAVDALKAHADVTLDRANGEGVTAFLRGDVVSGRQRVHPKRWRLNLGPLADGSPASVPASQLNMVIAGSSGRGKSYVAGLVAERLIGLGYSVLVSDPEGDHVGLGQLRGALVVGGGGRLPAPDELVGLLRHRFGSVVVDLSGVPEPERVEYLRVALPAVEVLRAQTGLPHWVVVDEAQSSLGRDAPHSSVLDAGVTGYCLVTHQPQELSMAALDGADVLLALPGREDLEPIIELVARTGGVTEKRAGALVRHTHPGQAVLVDRTQTKPPVVFTIAQRETPHLRHWHKYSLGRLPQERRFYFRSDWDNATGATAGSIQELEYVLRVCDDAVIAHHCEHRDISRWIVDVLGDPPLGAEVAEVEAGVRTGGRVAESRDRLVRIIHDRYPG